MNQQYNILFIMADQFRRDALYHLGGYGRTHALDALAADGVSFRGAVTTSPECIPARFALASGFYPHQTGVWRNGPVTLSPSAWNWTQALVAAGYRTSLFGKTHFHESVDLRDGIELMRGYGLLDVDEIGGPRADMWLRCAMTEIWQRLGLWDAYRRDFEERFANKPWIAKPSPLGLEHYYDSYVGRRALEYLSSYDRPQPWFCWVSFAGPHEPWDAPPPYDRMHLSSDMPQAIPRMTGSSDLEKGLLSDLFRPPGHAAPPTAGEIAALRANYAGNVTLIDDQIGALVDLLKKRAIYDNTLILFCSDHGEMNGDQGLLYKGNFLASAVDIPFIVRPPKERQRKEAGPADTLVELIDAGPTILDYAGVGWPQSSNGRSLRPILDGRSDRHRAYTISEFAQHTMIATRSWKCEFDSHDDPALLVNRLVDPFEQHNMIGDARVTETVANLRETLLAHRRATGDPHRITL